MSRPVADFEHASGPRIYDYLLGGKDSFDPDRALAGELIRAYPGLRELARVNRRFILAAVTWSCSARGISQFLDLGCGLPASPMVHEQARLSAPRARVAYADRDPGVTGRVLAEVQGQPGIAVYVADASDPAGTLAGLGGFLDLAAPVCVILGGTLSSMDPAGGRRAVAGYAEALAPGTAAVISCASYADPALGDRMAGMAGGDWRNLTLADVTSFFAAGGLEPAGGEVADVRCWPCAPSGARRDAAVFGGVGIRR